MKFSPSGCPNPTDDDIAASSSQAIFLAGSVLTVKAFFVVTPKTIQEPLRWHSGLQKNDNKIVLRTINNFAHPN